MVWCTAYSPSGKGERMTLYEGIILSNLFISLWTAYQMGRAKSDIENLYEGVSLAIDASTET